MKRSSLYIAILILGIGYLSIAVLYTSSEQFECIDKRTSMPMNIYLKLRSPLMFWSDQAGTLKVSGPRLFFVKKELGSLALYSGHSKKSYAGSFDRELLGIFINLPNRIFEGRCVMLR
jgi:hypothetical protein